MTTIYTLFRSIIGDETYGDYKVSDFKAFIYLDKAIDKLSEVHDNYYVEDVTVDAADVTAGFFELEHDVVQITDGLSPYNQNVNWKYGRNNKIMIFNNFPTGTFKLRYRGKYKKFDGQIRTDDYFDFDQDADFAVVLYAVGLYMQLENVNKVNDVNSGVITVRQEENQRIEYAVDGKLAEASSPQNLMEQAVDMMRSMSSGQYSMFSVRN